MILYSFDSSPNPLKVRVALREIGLECETREVVLFKGEQKSEEFLKVNPLGKVPVLVDDKVTLCESNAIIYYLAKEYGQPLWPKSSIEEAEALQWLFFESAHIAPHFGTVWFNKFGMPKLGHESQPNSEIQDSIESAEWALGHLEKHLDKNLYILGQEFSLVDCSIGIQVSILSETLLSVGNPWPNTSAYRDRIISRKSWRESNGLAIFDE